jgi:hypothetical protein
MPNGKPNCGSIAGLAAAGREFGRIHGMALLDVKGVHGPALWDEVRHTHWRCSSFRVHAGKNRQLDGSAAELDKVLEAYHGRGEGRHIVLA